MELTKNVRFSIQRGIQQQRIIQIYAGKDFDKIHWSPLIKALCEMQTQITVPQTLKSLLLKPELCT